MPLWFNPFFRMTPVLATGFPFLSVLIFSPLAAVAVLAFQHRVIEQEALDRMGRGLIRAVDYGWLTVIAKP